MIAKNFNAKKRNFFSATLPTK